MKKSGKKKILFAVSIAILMFIAMTAAFLTDKDSADNNFTVGEVELELQENFKKGQTLAAGQIIDKAPWVKNTGTVNELFFVEVLVPCMEATFLDANGQRLTPPGKTMPETPADSDFLQELDIFNLLADGTPGKGYAVTPVAGDTANNIAAVNHELSYNSPVGDTAGWVYLGRKNEEPVAMGGARGVRSGKYNIYLFGYSTWLTPGETSVPLFDRLQLRSIIDGDVDGGTIGQVQVNAYTIQADELKLTGLAGDGSTSNQYNEDDLKTIYKILENKDITPTPVP